jgi:hypothetical protein
MRARVVYVRERSTARTGLMPNSAGPSAAIGLTDLPDHPDELAVVHIGRG